MSRRVRALIVLMPVVAVLSQTVVGMAAGAQTTGSQAPGYYPLPTTTTHPDDGLNSTRRKSTTTTTTSSAPAPAPAPTTGDPGAPTPAPTGQTPGLAPSGPAGAAPAPDSGPVTPPTAGAFLAPDGSVDPSAAVTGPSQLNPGTVQSILDNQARSGASNTRALLDALRPLETIGFTPQEAAMMGMGHFPVGGFTTFTDDWGDPRGGGTRTHKGNDLFAAFDTPVRAPVDGVLRYSQEGLGGNAAYVTAPDGTYYYMAHLNSFAPDLTSGANVTQGQFIGLNGDSGNARGGSPHVHFEIHPGGGEAVNPKTILDGWIAEALAAAPQLVAANVQDLPQAGAVISTGLTRRFDDPSFFPQTAPMEAPMLWASSLNPAGSALGLAQATAARVTDSVDWDQRAASAQAQNAAWETAEDEARATLWRLAPPAINKILAGTVATSNGS
ncbi:MAG TPA: peptidoglycan DD-metalloendopeptidase family protein [Acidimicrobiales bacterium]|nr:peptidoglycan DD-metalloendopeptidase family protein [Acidimicrobiales bacterium]